MAATEVERDPPTQDEDEQALWHEINNQYRYSPVGVRCLTQCGRPRKKSLVFCVECDREWDAEFMARRSSAVDWSFRKARDRGNQPVIWEWWR